MSVPVSAVVRTLSEPAAPSAPAVVAVPPAGADLADLARRWPELVDAARRAGLVLIAEALQHGAPVSLAAGVLTIDVPEAALRRGLFAEHGEFSAMLLRLLSQTVGSPVRLVTRALAPTVSADDRDIEERKRRYRLAESHDLVRDLLKRFEADIVAREPATREEWEGRL